jgi:hypothetical protein
MVKIEDWLAWWEKEGCKLVLLKEEEKAGILWQLYSISLPYEAEAYGRHMGALVVIDKGTKEILLHDTTNDWVHGGVNVPDSNPSTEIYNWFERHVNDGIDKNV